MNRWMMLLLLATVCQLVLYGFFRLFLHNRLSSRIIRFTLLGMLFLSFVLPLHSLRLELGTLLNSSVYSEEGLIAETDYPKNIQPESVLRDQRIAATGKTVNTTKDRCMVEILPMIYLGIGLILLLRLLISLSRILLIRVRSRRFVSENIKYYITSSVKNSFSFFGWIFLNPEKKSREEQKNIIAHETIHVKQIHTLDMLLMELATAVLWFNPGIWMMRKTLQQVHEYLADEGALNTGVAKTVYQALLLNQVTEERLIALSSGFNPAIRTGRQSFIKKRIIMMTKPKLNQKTNLVLLTFLPLLVLLFIGVACINGQQPEENENTVAAVAPTKMNVLYLGVDNPVSIAVSGYDADDLKVGVDSGVITGENGYYIIRPARSGLLKVSVWSKKDELLTEKQFRVKTVPDPVAKIADKRQGSISQEELISAGKMQVVLENFDFDLQWVIVGFTVSAVREGYVIEYTSESDKLTAEQVELIQSLKPGAKIYFENIKAMGPDGSTRPLSALVFSIQK